MAFVNLVVLVLLANFVSDVKLESDIFHDPVPCTYNADCAGRWSTCDLKIGDKIFCRCLQGSSGPNCTVVDQCRDKVVDCGTDKDVSCLLGDGGRAYCSCGNDSQGYDGRTKTCRDCDCGEESLNYGCQFRDGVKKCECEIGAYQNEAGKCVDCGCGDGGIGCMFNNGVKTCKCFDGFAANGSSCINCQCGPNAKCKIENGKVVCICGPGYLPNGPDGQCMLECNAAHPCANGGTCSPDGACSCRNGTRGDLCQTIEECHYSWKCGEADCLYDVHSEKAYCKCRDPDTAFEMLDKKCLVCDCGSHSTSCKFNFKFRKCTCEKSYQDLDGTCTLCSCKGPSEEDSCSFDRQGNPICQCKKGYVQWKNECKRCDCGDDGVCEFDEFTGYKRCNCNKGYASDGDRCLPCDCGEHGHCGIYSFYETRCTCYQGFEVYEGKCLACDCGKNAECYFNSSGEKQCKCIPGYGMKSEVCTACDCGVAANCSFDESYNKTTKQCICPEGLSDDLGMCRECDCQLEGSNCTYTEGLRSCGCPEGFAEARNSSNQFTFCGDIDECLEKGACPESSKCVNTFGSYECVCAEKTPSWRDVKAEGCPTGGLGTLETIGIVAGCIIGVMVLFGMVGEYRKYRLQKMELQASHPYHNMTEGSNTE